MILGKDVYKSPIAVMRKEKVEDGQDREEREERRGKEGTVADSSGSTTDERITVCSETEPSCETPPLG